jgi:uncharacterized protein
MTELTVTVRGSFDAHAAPERGTVSLVVAFQGSDKAQTYEQTKRAAAVVTTALAGISNPAEGPVTWWASGRVRTWPEKPWNKDGKQLALVHHALVGIEAKFRDFDAMSRFIDQVTAAPGVSVSGIEWALTDATKAELTGQVRREAVGDAVRRAGDYAAALGIATLTPIAVAEPGMLGGDVRFAGEAAMSYNAGRRVASAEAASPLDLNPENVKVSAQVDVRFVTG